jgi:hypothetical protein
VVLVRHRQPAVVIQIHAICQEDLLLVADALDGLGLGLRFGQGGQQQRRQDGNDGDDHQQFDQGETAVHGADDSLCLDGGTHEVWLNLRGSRKRKWNCIESNFFSCRVIQDGEVSS